MNKIAREVLIDEVEIDAEENARNVDALLESYYEEVMDMIATDADGWEDAVIMIAEMTGW